MQGGKDGKLRLVNLANLANLAGSPAPGHLGGEVGSIINIPQGGGLFSQPAVWRNPADDSVWVFVANGSGLSGLRMQVGPAGNPSLNVEWSIPQGGTSPLVAGNVLYYAASGVLRAVSPTSGTILWSSPAQDVGAVHWQSPLVLNGVVYFTDGNAVWSRTRRRKQRRDAVSTSTRTGKATSAGDPQPAGLRCGR